MRDKLLRLVRLDTLALALASLALVVSLVSHHRTQERLNDMDPFLEGDHMRIPTQPHPPIPLGLK